MRPVGKFIALTAPLVSLIDVAPLAFATWRNNDRFSVWTLAAPFVIGAIAYPGYAVAVLRGAPRDSARRRRPESAAAPLWTRISLMFGLIASVSGLLLVLWYSRDVLAWPRAIAVATLHSFGSFFALVVCPAVSAFMCIRARLDQ